MNVKVPHPIPYQGSKRGLAGIILSYIPSGVHLLVEPFAGSAAVSLAAIAYGKVARCWLNDINEPLIRLWEEIIERPTQIARAYEQLWTAQLGREREFYDEVRDLFNTTHRPDYLLYLLARCVKAAVRYNSKGEFNQGPDNRRRGARPATMRTHILAASSLLKGRTRLTAVDYKDVLEMVSSDDVVYLDPPYQGVSTNRDQRYLSGVDYDEFVDQLDKLNQREISFIVSYDGRTGKKSHGKLLPSKLGLTRIEIDAGRSSQDTLLGRDGKTIESLYLSPALLRRLNSQYHRLSVTSFGHQQLRFNWLPN